MAEIKRFNFNQVAADLGYVAEPTPGGPGGPGGKPAGGPGGKPAGGPGGAPGGPGGAPGGPGGASGGPGGKPAGGAPNFSDPELIRKNALRFKAMWPDERSMKLINEYFADYEKSGDPIDFEGHSICWAMIALQQKLLKNTVYMYMPPFGKSLDLVPMKRVAEPQDNPMMKFDVTEQGDDVRIVVTLLGGGNPDPFQMPLSDVEIKEIGSGKNIWLELVGGHFLFMFAFPKTFGADCNTMYYKEGGETWYCVASNTPDVNVGDKPEKSPFEA